MSTAAVCASPLAKHVTAWRDLNQHFFISSIVITHYIFHVRCTQMTYVFSMPYLSTVQPQGLTIPVHVSYDGGALLGAARQVVGVCLPFVAL